MYIVVTKLQIQILVSVKLRKEMLNAKQTKTENFTLHSQGDDEMIIIYMKRIRTL